MTQRNLFDDAELVELASELDTDTGLVVRALGVKSINRDSRSVDVLASTDTLDSHGDIVEQSWDLDRYRSNPVVLFAHDHKSLPVGHADLVRVEGGALMARLNFVDEKANPIAEQVYQSFVQGSLRAVSVGFVPRHVRVEHDENGKQLFVLSDNELHEISAVPIPSNPETLGRMKQRAISTKLENNAKTIIASHAPPAGDSGGKWSGPQAKRNLRAWATRGDEVDFEQYGKGFVYYDAQKGDSLGAYKLPHHDVVDGELVTVRAGVIAAGNALQGARGGAMIPDAELAAAERHLARHYRQFDLVAPWAQDNAADSGKETRNMDQEKAISEATEQLAKQTAELEIERSKSSALQSRCDDLDAELTKATTIVSELTGEIVERDLDALVGVKMSAAEKPGLIKLATLDREVFNAQVEAIKSRPDMATSSHNVLGDDPNQITRGTDVAQDNNSNGGMSLAARIAAANA